MALLSPGVETRETSTQTTVVNSATGTAAIVGDFNWGPAFQVTQVTSEGELVSNFSTPDLKTADSFFSAANFLKYGNDLRVVRVVAEDTAQNDSPIYESVSATIANAGTGYTVGEQFHVQYTPEGSAAVNVSTCTITEIGTGGAVTKINIASYGIIRKLVEIGNYTTENDAGYIDLTAAKFTVDSTIIVGTGDGGGSNISINALKLELKSKVYFPNDSESEDALMNDSYAGECAKHSIPVIAARYPGNITSNIEVGIISYKDWFHVGSSPANVNDGVVSLHNFPYGTIKSFNANSYISYGPQEEDQFAFIVLMNGELVQSVILSLTPGAKDIYGANIYAEDYFRSGRSTYVSAILKDWPANYSGILSFGGGTSGEYKESTVDGATITANAKKISAYLKGWDHFADRSNISVNMLITGSVAGQGEEVASTVPKYVSDLATERQDCVAFISPPRDLLVNIPVSSAVDNIIAWRRGRDSNGSTKENNMNINSTYSFIDANYKYQYDKYNDINRWVPLSGDIAGLCARTDTVSQPWMSPAGFNRGQIQGVIKLAIDTRQSHRDRLYIESLNPVVSFSGQGVVLYGDKTATSKPSPFDRINVRRLFNMIKTSISRSSRYHVFELNDAFGQLNFRSEATAYMNRIKSLGGVYDFRVVCDATNNTPDVIDRNEMVAGIFVKPAKSVNFIYLSFSATSTSTDFDELVGRQ